MYRSVASRSALRSIATSARFSSAPVQRSFASQLCTAASRRPQIGAIGKQLALVRLASDKPVTGNINLKEEAKTAAKKITPHPELVSTTSSTHAINSELGVANEQHDTDMLAGIKTDLKTIRETFSLSEVPREAYYIGMAGVLPYLATSLSTVYCAYEINLDATEGTTILLSASQAEAFLHVLEPLQVGYGATIISFLGAIHWGLEFAGYGGSHGYSRYSIGVAAAALAWPTVLLPAQYALISQFLVFNFLYYTDSRATKRGWCPPWYAVYRFVLTFIVGASIALSLVGRGHVADRISRPHGPAERVQALRDAQGERSESEERAIRLREVEEDEEEEEEDEK